MHRTQLPAGAYWSAKLHWAQDDSPRPLFWWSDLVLLSKSHLPVLSARRLMKHRGRGSSLLLKLQATPALNFSTGKRSFFLPIFCSAPLNQMRFDLTVAGIQSRRDRGALFNARCEWGTAAGKLTVSAPCTPTDKRSRLKKKRKKERKRYICLPSLCFAASGKNCWGRAEWLTFKVLQQLDGPFT